MESTTTLDVSTRVQPLSREELVREQAVSRALARIAQDTTYGGASVEAIGVYIAYMAVHDVHVIAMADIIKILQGVRFDQKGIMSLLSDNRRQSLLHEIVAQINVFLIGFIADTTPTLVDITQTATELSILASIPLQIAPEGESGRTVIYARTISPVKQTYWDTLYGLRMGTDERYTLLSDPERDLCMRIASSAVHETASFLKNDPEIRAELLTKLENQIRITVRDRTRSESVVAALRGAQTIAGSAIGYITGTTRAGAAPSALALPSSQADRLGLPAPAPESIARPISPSWVEATLPSRQNVSDHSPRRRASQSSRASSHSEARLDRSLARENNDGSINWQAIVWGAGFVSATIAMCIGHRP
jgi:hypothetical protein